MSELKERLEEVLHGPTQTVADAERVAEAAAVLAAYLRVEEDAHRLFDMGHERQNSEPTRSRTNQFEGMTLHRAAQEVLEEAGTPLHVRELGKRIKAGGWRHKRSKNPHPDQIHYQLAARLPRLPKVFVRVAPNTFALTEWSSARPKPRPRIGLFRGASKIAGRDIGDQPDAAASSEWRSF